jgi:hypothetical protein
VSASMTQRHRILALGGTGTTYRFTTESDKQLHCVMARLTNTITRARYGSPIYYPVTLASDGLGTTFIAFKQRLVGDGGG